ncbi:MAG: uracil-DNA glycosylase [Bacteroidia bacterium]
MPQPADSIQIEAGWKEALIDEWSKSYFQQLKAFLVEEKKKGAIIYPPGPLIFNAFNMTPFDRVKVVIIGQDPYHGAGQAHGLSFSVPQGVRTPPSLINIYKELQADVGITPPNHGNLEAWAAQGVLLLNSLLTVRAGEAGSHKGKGWETFTSAVIRELDRQKEGLVFLLWGRYAHEKGAIINPQRHHVLKAAHPSPMAQDAFRGCRHFSRTNDILRAKGLEPIDWQV